MAKKKGGVSKKAVTKAKDRFVSDKTFGLKNKKKSKKVQQFVRQVKQQVHDKMSRKYGVNSGVGQMLTFEARQKRRQAEKDAKMMQDVTSMVAKTKKEPEKKPLEDIPAEFIQAVLEQFYQKYSRDKVSRIPLIMKKYEGEYHKLEVGLKKQYKDKAPNFQALFDKWTEDKKEEIDILEEAASWTGLTDQQICIQIEKKRRKLDISKCTKVTPETFKVWREKKMAEDKRVKEAQELEKKAKAKSQGRNVKLSGKNLYKLDASIFQDDEDAAEVNDVKMQEDPDYSDEEATEQERSKPADSAAVQDESLFLEDDDLPDSDDD